MDRQVPLRHHELIATWWLDELTTAGSEHLERGYVAGYDAKAQFDPTEDIDLLQRIGLDDSSILVDLGSGTGTFALAAAELGASTIAVDISPVMVATLRRRAAELARGKLTVVQAGFLSYVHQDGPGLTAGPVDHLLVADAAGLPSPLSRSASDVSGSHEHPTSWLGMPAYPPPAAVGPSHRFIDSLSREIDVAD